MPGYNPEYDPFQDAMTDEPQLFAGRASVSAWQCVLVKGQGKVPFDPTQHAGQKTSVCIEITIEPLDPTRKLIQRDMLNWTADFRQVVRPSVEALGEKIATLVGQPLEQINPLKALNDLWVQGEFVPRPDNKPGDTWTTLRFLAVYGSEDELRAAVNPAEPVPVTADPQRAALAAFLPALWTAAGKDAEKFHAAIASNPLLAPYFNPDSVEVMAVEAGI